MKGLVTILTILLMGAQAQASTISTTVSSARMKNKIGVTVGIGDPAPTVLGVSAHYNVTDYLKGSIGYGNQRVTTGITIGNSSISTTEASTSVIGFGAKGMVPGWSLSPTLGLHYANISYSGDGAIQVGGFTESGGHVYTSLGADWQTEGGLNLSTGYNVSFRSGIGGQFYFNAGWFWDFI